MGAFCQYKKHQIQQNRRPLESNQRFWEHAKKQRVRHFSPVSPCSSMDHTEDGAGKMEVSTINVHQSNSNIWRPWETVSTASEKNINYIQEIIQKFHCKFSDCKVTFGRENELRRHENSIHDRNIEFCPDCPLQFTRKDNLTRHMKAKHRNVLKPSCTFCKKLLSRQDAVQRHMTNCPKNPTRVNVEKVAGKGRNNSKPRNGYRNQENEI